jgi:hypothetical protein
MYTDANSDVDAHHFVSVSRDDEPTRDIGSSEKLIPESCAL